MTTATELEFESTDGMSDTCKAGLRNVLLACADTKLLLGYHYGEWTFGPPELEAAIASCSLCQTELGHVRLLHMVLERHYEDASERLIEGRDPAEFANIRYLDAPLTDWPGFVAANYIVDLAVTRLLYAMRGSSFKPIRMSLEKMLDEERYHVHHGQGWFRTLARTSEAARGAVERSVGAALAAVIEWFGPAGDPEDAALVAAGVKAQANPDIVRHLLNDLRQTATAVGVALVPASPAFDGWDPRTRRLTPGGPDDEILYHLRGSKNAMFKLN